MYLKLYLPLLVLLHRARADGANGKHRHPHARAQLRRRLSPLGLDLAQSRRPRAANLRPPVVYEMNYVHVV